MQKIINEFIDIISNILSNNITKSQISKRVNAINCETVYESDNQLVTDTYFTLKHYASNEEDIHRMEFDYLLKCLKGEERYCIDTKVNLGWVF